MALKSPALGAKQLFRLPGHGPAGVFERPERRAIGFERPGEPRRVQARELAAQQIKQGRVQGAAADQCNAARGPVPDQLGEFVGHHEAEPGNHVGFWLALVERVRAVALAEHAAPAGDLVWSSRPGKLDGLLRVEPHAPDLLVEKLARARSAFVARPDRNNTAVRCNAVYKLGFAARAHYQFRKRAAGARRPIFGTQRILDGLRFR